MPHVSEFYVSFCLYTLPRLLSENLCFRFCSYVEDLLIVFVKNFSSIFGKKMLVNNVHNLIHLVEDVQKYGPLDNIYCSPYENMLGKPTKMVRRPQNPIEHIVNRIMGKTWAWPGESNIFILTV